MDQKHLDNNLSNKLKIYFCGSMRGVEANMETYKSIVAELKKYGTVLTEHVANPSIEYAIDDKEIFQKDWNAFQKANCMVAEVTAPSHGVGIELGWAMLKEELPILCIACRKKQFKISALISGSPLLTYMEYDGVEEVVQILEDFFKRKFIFDEKLESFKN